MLFTSAPAKIIRKRRRWRRCSKSSPARWLPTGAALTQRPWLGGSEYGLADIAYVPWLLRARETLGVSFEAYPSVSAWLDRLLERPAVAAEAELVAAL